MSLVLQFFGTQCTSQRTAPCAVLRCFALHCGAGSGVNAVLLWKKVVADVRVCDKTDLTNARQETDHITQSLIRNDSTRVAWRCY